MPKIMVKPTEKGEKTPNPQNRCRPYKKEGETVVKDRYVLRRIKDGDLVEVKSSGKSKKS